MENAAIYMLFAIVRQSKHTWIKYNVYVGKNKTVIAQAAMGVTVYVYQHNIHFLSPLLCHKIVIYLLDFFTGVFNVSICIKKVMICKEQIVLWLWIKKKQGHQDINMSQWL